MITEKFTEQSPVLSDQHISLKAAKKTHMEWHTPPFYGEKLATEHQLARRRQAAEMMLATQLALEADREVSWKLAKS